MERQQRKLIKKFALNPFKLDNIIIEEFDDEDPNLVFNEPKYQNKTSFKMKYKASKNLTKFLVD